MKIWVIGHHEAILGYSLVGVEGKPVSRPEEASAAMEEALANPEIGIILVTSEAAKWLGTRMDYLRLHSRIPLVVEIPGPEKVQTECPSLAELIYRTIGIRV